MLGFGILEIQQPMMAVQKAVSATDDWHRPSSFDYGPTSQSLCPRSPGGLGGMSG
jgi:hypothetical protein